MDALPEEILLLILEQFGPRELVGPLQLVPHPLCASDLNY